MPHHIRVLLLPSDRTPTHIIALKTITLEPNAPNASLGHHPDFRKYWGPQGWERRVATSMLVQGEEKEKLNGKYWLWTSLADAWLKGNGWVGEHCFGDAFVVKVAGDGGDEKGDAAYVDVSRELIGSELLKKMVKEMAEPTEM